MAEYVFEIDETRADAMGNMPCERREEIVRCRDCDAYGQLDGFCDMLQRRVMPDGFCAWGERDEKPC